MGFNSLLALSFALLAFSFFARSGARALLENRDLVDGSLGPAPIVVYPSLPSQEWPVAGPLWVCSAGLNR